jgi:acylaminoacyl-peptidase
MNLETLETMTSAPAWQERAQLFERIRDVPTIDNGQLTDDGCVVQLSQVDLRDGRKKFKRTFATTFVNGRAVGLPSDVGDAALHVVSPSGRFVAVVKTTTADEPAKTASTIDHVVEVWSPTRRLLRIPVLKTHHRVHNDGFHGHLTWSADEQSLVYVAEAKRPKTAPFFADAEREADAKVGEEHVFVDDFGEALTGRSLGRIFLVHLASASVRAIGADADAPSAGLSLGQPVFSPDGKWLAYTGWVVQPFRMGMYACFNRPSFVFVASLADNSIRRVGPADLAAMHRSPRFTPRSDGLVLLVNENAVAHSSTAALAFASLASLEQLRTVVDIVQQPANVDTFPGLYLAQLPARPFVSDDELVCTSTWFSAQTVIKIKLSSGAVERVTLPASLPSIVSADLLDARVDRLLVSASAPTLLPAVFEARRGADRQWQWTALDAGSRPPQDAWTADLALCKTTLHQLSAGGHTYEYLLLTPGAPGKHRTILFPHGGPHVATPASFAASCAFFLLCNYAVVLVNYRGSTGQGEAALRSLLGNVGENDVADCFSALQHALDHNESLDPSQVWMFGGSHGGFLSGHCIARTFKVAREPHTEYRFRSCAMRNPVTNIASMSDSTDIGDWCQAEAGAGKRDYAKMLACSPMAHVDKVRVPVLLLVGEVDRRVPPAQSVEYYRALKQHGCKVEMKVYAGQSHGLANLASMEADGIVNSLLWFDAH